MFCSTDECEHMFEHNFLFSTTYPRGISSVVYGDTHSMLIIAGLPSPSTDLWQTQAGKEGITAWRVLSGFPHYKMVTDYEQDAKVCSFHQEIHVQFHYISTCLCMATVQRLMLING